jgi:hypothetical protein
LIGVVGTKLLFEKSCCQEICANPHVLTAKSDFLSHKIRHRQQLTASCSEQVFEKNFIALRLDVTKLQVIIISYLLTGIRHYDSLSRSNVLKAVKSRREEASNPI